MSMIPFAGPLRSTLSALAAAALIVTASGCDTTDVYETTATYVDFRLNTSDPNSEDRLSANGKETAFDDRDVISPDDQDRLRAALDRAGDGALVIAYIDSEVVLDVVGTGQTYSAMPVTRGFEGVPIRIDEDGDGVPEEIPYVDSIVTYGYSFDNGAFYFDVTSSAALDFTDVLPSAVDFRVVTLPASAAFARAGARVDLRDYQAVKAAYNLPD